MRISIQPLLAAFAIGLCLSGCSTMPSWMPFSHPPMEQIAAPSVPATAYGAEHPMAYAEHGDGMMGIAELHYQVESESIARDASCSADPTARLLEKGPGFETYSVPCGTTRVMLIRCEFSYCRTMQ